MRSVVLALVLAVPALANPKAAAVHNRQAKAYFDAKQYDAAIAEFKQSYDLDKKPLTLFKIASAYYAKGDYENAIAFYGQYLQADPEGPYAAQALEFTTVAKKALDDERAKREAAEAAARKAEEDKRAAAELEKKKLVIEGHLKNAKAFEAASTWTSAADEYMAACIAGGDPEHMIRAGAAYTRAGDHAKASAAYRKYLEKVPGGAKSDEVRTKLAESTRLLEEAEAKKRVAIVTPSEPRDKPVVPERPPITRGVSSYGVRAAFGISIPDTNPYKMNSSDGLVFQPSLDIGGYARYQLLGQIALRPEATIVYRGGKFDGDSAMMMTQINVVDVKRAGLALALPIFFSVTASRNGFRLGGGPFLAFMPYMDFSNKPGFPPAGDTELWDYGLLAGIEIDFGLVSLEARFAKSFGKIASDVDATTYTLLAGLTFGFDR